MNGIITKGKKYNKIYKTLEIELLDNSNLKFYKIFEDTYFFDEKNLLLKNGLFLKKRTYIYKQKTDKNQNYEWSIKFIFDKGVSNDCIIWNKKEDIINILNYLAIISGDDTYLLKNLSINNFDTHINQLKNINLYIVRYKNNNSYIDKIITDQGYYCLEKIISNNYPIKKIYPFDRIFYYMIKKKLHLNILSNFVQDVSVKNWNNFPIDIQSIELINSYLLNFTNAKHEMNLSLIKIEFENKLVGIVKINSEQTFEQLSDKLHKKNIIILQDNIPYIKSIHSIKYKTTIISTTTQQNNLNCKNIILINITCY